MTISIQSNSSPASHPSTPRPTEAVQYEDLPPEELGEKISHLTNDGPPAHPEWSPTRLVAFVAFMVISVILAGVIAAFIFGPIVGLCVGFFGLVFALANPAVWGTLSRAGDRAEAARRVTEDDTTGS